MNFLAGFLIVLAVYSGAAGFLIPAAAGTAPEFEAAERPDHPGRGHLP